MKLTTAKLRQIIKEELEATLNEKRNTYPTANWKQEALAAIEDEGMRPSAGLKRHIAKMPKKLDLRDMSALEDWFGKYKELRSRIEGYGTVGSFDDLVADIKSASGYNPG